MVGLPVDGRQETILSTREGILSLIKSSTSFVKQQINILSKFFRN